jgi:hypothetical protein
MTLLSAGNATAIVLWAWYLVLVAVVFVAAVVTSVYYHDSRWRR